MDTRFENTELKFEESRERNLKKEINRALAYNINNLNFDIEDIKKIARMFYYEGYKKGSKEGYNKAHDMAYVFGWHKGYSAGRFDCDNSNKNNMELA